MQVVGVSGSSSDAYSYDPVGNRSSLGSSSYSYDRADRITSAGTTSYTVNANGNLTARGSDTFGYDQANRLKTASVGGTSSTYAYDGDGKRASKTVGGTPTNYVYDVNASLPVLLDDGARKYVWGLGLAFAVDASGSPIVYHTDGLGSVRALTDVSGTVVQGYLYDEYGNVLSSSGSITQPFQYTGEQRDETGFMYLRARTLDPQSGRFTSRDTRAGVVADPSTLNRYAYAMNNPTGWRDPSGRSSASIVRGAQPSMNGLFDVSPGVPLALRLPDYYNLTVNASPPMFPIIGVTVQVIVDKNGHVYVSPGGNVGKSLTVGSGSLSGGWILGSPPDEKQLIDFLSGWSDSGSGGWWGGGGLTWGSPTPPSEWKNWDWQDLALELGFYTPQAGVSATYGFRVR